MYKLPRFLAKSVPGFEIVDVKEWLNRGEIEIYAKKLVDAPTPRCCRCQSELKGNYGRHPLRLRTLDIMQYQAFIHLWRHKGYCGQCKKVRSENLDFISPESPHLTEEYAFWLGRLCEVTAVTSVAELSDMDAMSVYRFDFARLRRMFQQYKIPEVRRLSVDEVYAKRRNGHRAESRDQSFFTVITDLSTRRVVWVSQSRSKKALDEFFQILGPERCQKIEVVAIDQHDAYKASVQEHCPQAKVVWDRFHLLQTFERALDESRKELHEKCRRGSEIHRLTRGKWRFMFLKREDRRTFTERQHMASIFELNEDFFRLEWIKERFFSFFEARDQLDGEFVLSDIQSWIELNNYGPLKKWFTNLMQGWETLKNWFDYRVTTSLSEGINNVIKMVKRRGFGYKNMAYFKLKILQVCGFLNSRYVPMGF